MYLGAYRALGGKRHTQYRPYVRAVGMNTVKLKWAGLKFTLCACVNEARR